MEIQKEEYYLLRRTDRKMDRRTAWQTKPDFEVAHNLKRSQSDWNQLGLQERMEMFWRSGWKNLKYQKHFYEKFCFGILCMNDWNWCKYALKTGRGHDVTCKLESRNFWDTCKPVLGTNFRRENCSFWRPFLANWDSITVKKGAKLKFEFSMWK